MCCLPVPQAQHEPARPGDRMVRYTASHVRLGAQQPQQLGTPTCRGQHKTVSMASNSNTSHRQNVHSPYIAIAIKMTHGVSPAAAPAGAHHAELALGAAAPGKGVAPPGARVEHAVASCQRYDLRHVQALGLRQGLSTHAPQLHRCAQCRPPAQVYGWTIWQSVHVLPLLQVMACGKDVIRHRRHAGT